MRFLMEDVNQWLVQLKLAQPPSKLWPIGFSTSVLVHVCSPRETWMGLKVMNEPCAFVMCVISWLVAGLICEISYRNSQHHLEACKAVKQKLVSPLPFNWWGWSLLHQLQIAWQEMVAVESLQLGFLWCSIWSSVPVQLPGGHEWERIWDIALTLDSIMCCAVSYLLQNALQSGVRCQCAVIAAPASLHCKKVGRAQQLQPGKLISMAACFSCSSGTENGHEGQEWQRLWHCLSGLQFCNGTKLINSL